MVGCKDVSDFKDFLLKLIRTVIKTFQLMPSSDMWETAQLAGKLGTTEHELANILEGSQKMLIYLVCSEY